MEFEKLAREVNTAKKIASQKKSIYSSRRVGISADYRDPRWRDLRARVLTRDGNVCQSCKSTWDLQVHHVRYIRGKRIWDSPITDLVTLCDECHRKVHNIISGREDVVKKKKRRRK